MSKKNRMFKDFRPGYVFTLAEISETTNVPRQFVENLAERGALYFYGRISRVRYYEYTAVLQVILAHTLTLSGFTPDRVRECVAQYSEKMWFTCKKNQKVFEIPLYKKEMGCVQLNLVELERWYNKAAEELFRYHGKRTRL